MGKNKKKKNINNSRTTEEVKNNTILAVPEDIDEKKSDNIEYNNELTSSQEKGEFQESDKAAEVNSEEFKENESSKVPDKKEDIKQEKNIDTSSQIIPSEPVKKKSYIKIVIISCIIIGILLLALLFSTIFALINSGNENIYRTTYIENIDVSGLTKQQALEKLNSNFNEKLSKIIVLKHNDYQTQISLSQIELSFDYESAVNSAYSKGRSGNIFKDNYDILFSSFSNTTINPGFSYNEEIINTLIKDMTENISDRLVEPSYYIEGNDLLISRGNDGNIIASDTLKKQINNIVSDLNNSNLEIDIPVIFKKVDNIDLNKIYNEIHKSPVNAYYTTDPYVIYPHVDGIDFAISMEEAQNLVNSSSESEISIPLTVTSPEITTNDLGDEAFPNTLSAFSTTYSTNNVNRSTNIRLASDKINGTVVMPGEVFSYNTTVGQRTAAAGFKAAAVYSGGEVTTGLGGGICQVSSTLYNAVLLAGLDIVERQNHGFNPGYVPVGRDATVSWGAPDFKFQNTRNYPIKIVCDGTGGTITVEILGLKENDEYDIEIESYVTRWISYSTITRPDPNLEPGETRVIQSGSSGCTSVAYRIYYKDGEEIERELLSQDTYSPHNKIVAVGN
ncbi:MAG: VanW family protein [Clostridia bacterium]|nr:VanW family protein [Clostridia bacterium]